VAILVNDVRMIIVFSLVVSSLVVSSLAASSLLASSLHWGITTLLHNHPTTYLSFSSLGVKV